MKYDPKFHIFVEDAKKFVETRNLGLLSGMMVWNDTPQGHRFWRSVVDGEIPVSVAVPLVEDMIRWSEERDKSTEESIPVTYDFGKMCFNEAAARSIVETGVTPDKVMDLCAWTRTPQGSDYWLSAYSGRLKNDEVRHAVEDMLRQYDEMKGKRAVVKRTTRFIAGVMGRES